EFHRGLECYLAGETAAKKMVETIKREIRNKRLRQFLLGKPQPSNLSKPNGKQALYFKEINEEA
ncbi:MAG: hypothetical protein HYR79_03775, partial [Nitrospirae bacterium]|nr:hypothetical protein [Nitrospirota bacterium]